MVELLGTIQLLQNVENVLNNSFVVNFSCEALSKASKLGLTSFMEKSFTHFPTPALPKAQSCFPQNGHWEKKKFEIWDSFLRVARFLGEVSKYIQSVKRWASRPWMVVSKKVAPAQCAGVPKLFARGPNYPLRGQKYFSMEGINCQPLFPQVGCECTKRRAGNITTRENKMPSIKYQQIFVSNISIEGFAVTKIWSRIPTTSLC